MVLQSRVRRFAMHWLRMTQRSRVRSRDVRENKNPAASRSIYSATEKKNDFVSRLSRHGEFASVSINKKKYIDTHRVTEDTHPTKR